MEMIARTKASRGLALLSASLALGLSMGAASAQSGDAAYPGKDIHVASAFPPGSGADVLVRFFAERMRAFTEKPVLVENKAGAGGYIATQYVAKAKPDGYTMFIHAGNTLASNHYLIKGNKVDAAKEIQVAATINKQAFMLVVEASKPWKTVAELTAYLKGRGDKSSYATAANSGVVMCAMYKELAKLETVEVNYKMAQDSLNDMANGTVDFGCHDPVFALSQAREGRLRILAVASNDRLKAAPEIPSMSEAGYKMDLVGWFSVMVPAATPKPIVDKINGWFKTIHQSPETSKFLTNFGGDPWVSTPDEGQARLLKDIKDWEEYVRIAKLKPQS
jgi:tripartite-type tricarboxylate transporter receptor subunit TctC